MFGWLSELFNWFFRLWNRLDDKTKGKIIEEVVKSFEKLLRAFYGSWKNRHTKGE
jgi:hypothetical protein